MELYIQQLEMLDKSISDMDVDMYKTIIGVKIDASVNMAMVFENEPLDLILYFSSVASFSKLGGQSGYVTGCTFKDGFAHGFQKKSHAKLKRLIGDIGGMLALVSHFQKHIRLDYPCPG